MEAVGMATISISLVEDKAVQENLLGQCDRPPFFLPLSAGKPSSA
jgi:hypothetical protein